MARLREPPRRTPLAAAIAGTAVIAVIGATATGAGAAHSGGATAPSSAHSTPLDGNGMWIWYVSKSGGSAPAIVARARAHKIRTVFVKSGDGTNYWSFPFTPQFLASLKAGGLPVCASPYGHGGQPRVDGY